MIALITSLPLALWLPGNPTDSSRDGKEGDLVDTQQDEPEPQFDSEAFKKQQLNNWNQLSNRWNRWHEVFERGAHVVTARLMELSGARRGNTVLDVGTGTGEPAISAAELVGPDGRVLSVDQADDMVSVARQRAHHLDNLEFLVEDAESLQLPKASHDIVVSRFTLMFLPNRGRTLRSLAATLKPNGVLVASSWSAPAEAPVISLAFGEVAKLLELPPPPRRTPGPFSMASPTSVVDEFECAGFADVAYEQCRMNFEMASAEEFADFSLDLLPAGIQHALCQRFGMERPEALYKVVVDAATAYASMDGRLVVPSLCWCFRARRV